MDKARYVLALLTVITFPPAIAFWIVVHPLIGFWRRLGPAPTYAVLFSLMALMGYGVVRIRESLLAIEFGTNYFLWPLVLISYGAAIWVEVRCRKHLKVSKLLGLPELAPHRPDNTLLTEGIYAEVRHPRYLGGALGLLAIALFVNYLAIYLLLPLFVAGLYWVAVLEEAELRQRFGAEYDRYCQRVPRFLPNPRFSR